MSWYFDEFRRRYPEKFVSCDRAFSSVRRGSRIFVGTGCGEPQYLVSALVGYVESHPKAVLDAEIVHVWTLGVAPYTQKKFERNFRHNSFFISSNTREAVNKGYADYTPIFLSEVPALFKRGVIGIDIALLQTSPPDRHGYMSLGVSVDIVKAAAEVASIVIAQVNSKMPRVHGDGFINIRDVTFVICYDEDIIELKNSEDEEVADRIGYYVSRLIQDGDTIQVGYGSIPNAVLSNLTRKKHLGVHTELMSDGIVELMKKGVIDNTQKTLNPGKTVASFCMGSRETYDFIDDNPAIEFRTVDYTNNPLIIAQHKGMTAINSALEIDLTGQATAESLGELFYSGIGGQADFMRGAALARGGKTILAMRSTAAGGGVSRIVPCLKEGAGVTLSRGDVHYVVTEYGVAYLHGKNIRERAMELISIAHPDYRAWLIEEAKKRNLIYKDQAFIPGKRGEYPEELETFRTTRTGLEIFLRPVKVSDEPLLKEFFYSLSDQSLYRRFLSTKKGMPHEDLQSFVVIDYTREMAILAVLPRLGKEEVIGLGQYWINEDNNTAEVAFAVKDAYQNAGVGTELLKYLTQLARRRGLMGFTAEVLMENQAMLHLFEKMGFAIEKRVQEGVCELKMTFID